MRFLLYHDTAAKAAPRISKVLLRKGGKDSLSNGRDSGVSSGLTVGRLLEPTVASTSTEKASLPGGEKKKVWGQQCSATCGCVVRFEAQVSTDGKDILEHVSYHAKKLVTIAQKEQDGIGSKSLRVQLTAKGRPMFEECKCKTLHQLCRLTIRHMIKQETLPKFKNAIEFRKNRSSPAFCRSVLNTQGLPPVDTHCFDVVEEAVTALCKGHMPAPRRVGQILPATECYGPIRQQMNENRNRRQRLHQFLDDDGENEEHYQFLKFGHGWKDDDAVGTGAKSNSESTWVSAVLDALKILPISSIQHRKQQLAYEASSFLVESHVEAHDWISYVDEIQELEKQDGNQTSATG